MGGYLRSKSKTRDCPKFDRSIITCINYWIKTAQNIFVQNGHTDVPVIDYRVASLSTRFHTATGIIPEVWYF